jgi:hypothetical protein
VFARIGVNYARDKTMTYRPPDTLAEIKILAIHELPVRAGWRL